LRRPWQIGSKRTMPCPFMMHVCFKSVRKNDRLSLLSPRRRLRPPQTVSSLPIYHRLIESFRTFTGIPMVLNKSFNENESVVCKPHEALDCFLRRKWTSSFWEIQSLQDETPPKGPKVDEFDPKRKSELVLSRKLALGEQKVATTSIRLPIRVLMCQLVPSEG
jgi:hypothetical protein